MVAVDLRNELDSLTKALLFVKFAEKNKLIGMSLVRYVYREI